MSSDLRVTERQFLVSAGFAVLLAIIIAILYLQDRRREWMLRSEQAMRRLDVAVELISREVDRVCADALFLADQKSPREFVQGDKSQRAEIEQEFANFVRRKQTYDQIRLLDIRGLEQIRVNFQGSLPISVPQAELQDKSDRYYFSEALSLRVGEVFVSDFDLNLEHGEIEKPLKPVIRFVAPIPDDAGSPAGFIVLNYLGANVLGALNDFTLPGSTILLRPDGHFIRGINPGDSWGWLLGHERTFASQFPGEWQLIDELRDCTLTSNGGFAARRIDLDFSARNLTKQPGPSHRRDSIIAVSYLPRSLVFADSNQLLKRLLWLAGFALVLFAIFSRYWARATASRERQNRQIAESEERLRELSSRLLRIQEDERRAISREIHDEFGQQVTAINLDLKLADRKTESEDAKSLLQRAIHENEELLQSLHLFATRVRPAVLDDLGLRDAIESHLRDFESRTGIAVDAEICLPSTELPNEIADNVFRVLQESLNNVAKHAGATRVVVTVSIEEQESSGMLYLAIRDDGRGFSPTDNNHRRLGIVGMRERVDLLSGDLRVKSDIDLGTDIEVRLPLPGFHREGEERG